MFRQYYIFLCCFCLNCNYFDNNIKETIWNFLRKKSCNIFNISYSFDDIIKSERKEQIKNHYINKFYVDIQKENTKTC